MSQMKDCLDLIARWLVTYSPLGFYVGYTACLGFGRLHRKVHCKYLSRVHTWDAQAFDENGDSKERLVLPWFLR